MHIFLFLAALPALSSAAWSMKGSRHVPFRRFIQDDDSLQFMDPDLTNDPTTFKEFAKFYVKLFEDMLKTKTTETYQAHNNYVDIEMLFNECNAPQYENYGMYMNWLQQFVANHNDPIIKIKELKGDQEKGEMLLNVDVETHLKFRLNFDMKVSCLNDKGLGWKVLVVDRSIGCNKKH